MAKEEELIIPKAVEGNENNKLAKQLSRNTFYRFVNHNLDDYGQVQLSKEEARKIHAHIQKLSTGSAAMVPLYCGGEKCPFRERCPLFEMKKHPEGKQCLIEVQLLKEWIIRFFDEYDVDPNNLTEVAYVNELAEIEIYLMRLNMSLARPENAEMVIDQVVDVAKDGTPIVQKQESPFAEQRHKLLQRKSKIIKLMVGDRQEKYKKEAALKVKLDADPSSKMAAMRAKLENLSRELNQLSSKQAKSANPADPQAPQKQDGVLTPQDLIDSEEG